MQVLNQVNYNGRAIQIKHGPFGNTFVQHGDASFEDGLVRFYAYCTEDSEEPGRIYACWATIWGELRDYFTVN